MTDYLLLFTVVCLYMTVWFGISLVQKRNDIADTAWGLGFVVLAWTAFFWKAGFHTTALVINTLVTIWGLRLAYHIHQRNKNKPEDYRYQAWRNQWGKWFKLRSFFQVFLLQGFLLFCISLPVMFANLTSSLDFGILQGIGIGIWLIGFTFEALGDKQLADFVKNPENKGKILQTGLWRYSRHPNYFGEITGWWGIWIISLTGLAGWLTVIGPLTISFLIIKVSGIPLLEKKMWENLQFRVYAQKTNRLFPWIPKQ